LSNREIDNVNKSGVVAGNVIKFVVGGGVDSIHSNANWGSFSDGDASGRARGDGDSRGIRAVGVRIEGIFSDTNVPVSSEGKIVERALIFPTVDGSV